MKKSLPILGVVSLALFASPANASGFNYGNLSQVTAGDVNSIIETIGIGADHRPYMPASPLGMLIGIDAGIEVTGVSLPDDFKAAMAKAGNSESIPTLLPVPRLTLRKGLPFGVDLGFSYAGYQSYKLVAGEIQYSIIHDNAALPAVAVRASYGLADISYITTHTVNVEALVSKSFAFVFEPYAGLGMQFVNGNIAVPVGGPNGLSTTVSASGSASALHLFVGLPLKLTILHLTPEYDYSFAGMTSIGAKVSLNF